MEILVVDDEPFVLEMMEEMIDQLGHKAHGCSSGEEALEFYKRHPVQVVITDMRMPGMDGMSLLRNLKAIKSRDTEILLCSGGGAELSSVKAKRAGAYEYLQKPIDMDELALVIERIESQYALLSENKKLNQDFDSAVEATVAPIQDELLELRSAVNNYQGIGIWIARSGIMENIYRDCLMYHQNPDTPVLIEGETGTGKEMIAKLIHFGEGAVKSPFVDINCAAISKELFESELFGYSEGAFTGAKLKGARGKIDFAGKGTIFLDEIGDMPHELQPKLLRVIQERYYYPVGSVERKPFQCRLVCATHVDLEQQVEDRLFRRDLFFRLNVGRIYIPPLRERPEDIVALADYFLQRENIKKKKKFKKFTEEAKHILLNFPWPGNVRQLEHAIERIVLTCDDSRVRESHFAFLNFEGKHLSGERESYGLPSISLPSDGLNIERFMDFIVTSALDKFSGNKSRTAAYLGISRYALHRRLKNIQQIETQDGRR